MLFYRSDNDAGTSCKQFKRTVNTARGKPIRTLITFGTQSAFERLLLWVILKRGTYKATIS